MYIHTYVHVSVHLYITLHIHTVTCCLLNCQCTIVHNMNHTQLQDVVAVLVGLVFISLLFIFQSHIILSTCTCSILILHLHVLQVIRDQVLNYACIVVILRMTPNCGIGV